QRAANVIDAQRRAGHTVWVCCALGVSRSAAATIAWLRLHGMSASLGDAEAQVRRVRPQIVLRSAWQNALDHATRHTRTP
ncbi:MAG TPA: dual specificity protein phosphatase family protein, partial [Variovorax sp.]